MIDGSLTFTQGFPSKGLAEWGSELARLDKLPPDMLRQELRARVAGVAIGAYRRTRLAEDSLFLAPLSADPLTETPAQFRRRAGDHFRARDLRLRRIAKEAGGVVEVLRKAPRLHDHAEWVVRRQIHGQSGRAIARSVGFHGHDQRVTVEKAIREFAALIDLPVRRLRPGRPPKRRNTKP